MKDNHKEEDVSEASDVMTSNENSISESGTNPVKMLEPEENISTTSDISPSSADVDKKTNVNINADNHVATDEDMDSSMERSLDILKKRNGINISFSKGGKKKLRLEVPMAKSREVDSETNKARGTKIQEGYRSYIDFDTIVQTKDKENLNVSNKRTLAKQTKLFPAALDNTSFSSTELEGYEHEDETSANAKDTNNNLQTNDGQVAKENMAMYEDDSNEKKVDAYKDENNGDTIQKIAATSSLLYESREADVNDDSLVNSEEMASLIYTDARITAPRTMILSSHKDGTIKYSIKRNHDDSLNEEKTYEIDSGSISHDSENAFYLNTDDDNKNAVPNAIDESSNVIDNSKGHHYMDFLDDVLNDGIYFASNSFFLPCFFKIVYLLPTHRITIL